MSHSGTAQKGKLLVFDDIHLICPKRGGYSAGSDRLTATLLALIDGISIAESGSVTQNIVILAITTNPSFLDPALRRPGRIDSEVEVPIPDEASTRSEILQFQLDSIGATLPDISSDEWMALGKLAKGFNGADCMLAVKEALRSALLRQMAPAITLGESSQPLKAQLSLDDLKTAIRHTKPSAIKSVTVEIPQVLWSSIGGMDSVKKELREAIELPLTHSELFTQLRVPPPRGILLYGPPGCSKTLMARALATEGNMNFLAVKGPELLSKWLGESERALASLFRRARMASPCIIFFDEVDAIASKRGNGDSASSGRLLSQLLTELDGVNHTGSAAGSKPQRVVVVGATNRPDLLDSALTRPGRIDRMIYVGVPDAASRASIFELGLKDKSYSDDIDINHLARDDISEGFSGAEVVAICRDAALLALEESEELTADSTPKLHMRHLLRAITSMQRQITPEMLDFYASFRKSPSRNL
jgi:SpoVK/Ycf46/Vps4 family AAA+-type ATPase